MRRRSTHTLLKENGIQISMSRKEDPYDNGLAESFMEALKHEEVHRSEYREERKAS